MEGAIQCPAAGSAGKHELEPWLMADFQKALSFVLGNEGGFENDPNDEGGATNYGVTLRYLRSLSDEKLRGYGFYVPPDLLSIEKMTLDQATAVYKGEFWDCADFGAIQRQSICNYVFDMAVNHGPSIGIKLLQRAICACMMSREYLPDDGLLGEKTISAMDRGTLGLPSVLVAQRAQYYRELVHVRPADREFLDGWLVRAFRFG
jgi:lysozyme family protein